MKTEKWVLLCMILLLVQLVACERTDIESLQNKKEALREGAVDDSTSTRRIKTAKITGIKQREPIKFTLINGVSQFVKWRVSPSANLVNCGDSALVYFANPGAHRVFAIDSLSLDTTFIDVEIDVYEHPEPKLYQQSFFEDDEIYITPVAKSDSAQVMEFQAITKRNYECLNNNLMLYRTQNGNNSEIIFDKVLAGTSCSPGEKKAQISIWFVLEELRGNIEISFNNKLYKGSYERTGKNYTFNWPYETGVVFTKKSL